MEEISTNLIAQPVLCEDDLQCQWKQLNMDMEQYSKKGKYIQAQNCRMASEKLKKQIDASKKQKKETKQVKNMLKEETKQFHQEWDQKITLFEEQGRQLCCQMKAKHKKQQEEAKAKMEEEIPEQCKDSSECLNLRKIEQGLAKQHNYLEAHKVQQIIKMMQVKEQEAWLKIRSEKIWDRLQELKQKQQIEMQAMKKRAQSGKWDLQIEKTKEQAKLLLKHANIKQDIQSENKKECLTVKGELKSKIDLLSPTKSRLTSPNTKSRLLSTR